MKLKISDARSVIKSAKGRIFSATFVKKNGEIRVMTARTGVKKHLKGTGMKYNPEERNLIGVFDMTKRQYRTINIGTLLNVKIAGVLYNVYHDQAGNTEVN
jgi:hypothetical protein